MLFKKKFRENDCCRYCKNAADQGNDIYVCKYKGTVKPGGICRKYVFNPFAHRIRRVRSIDTTMFDPLDFKI
ncbi:MAG: hypothetical protein UIL37_07430 [Clostridia bacterium]|nr:hypothetical protein [Clostridia bacterium]